MKTIFTSSLNKKIVISLFSFLLLFINNALANTNISIGPTIGKKAPDITVINTQQQSVNIKQLSSDKGLIILFFRSADWCPFCKKHLIELNDQAKQFTQLGYGLAAISYDNTDILKKFAEQQHINYPLLSDQKVQTMSAYDIVNKEYSVDDDNYGIPYPGVVVIDNKGNVMRKHFFKGYKNRVKFTELYLQLKNGT
jgi:peroxiredoxin